MGKDTPVKKVYEKIFHRSCFGRYKKYGTIPPCDEWQDCKDVEECVKVIMKNMQKFALSKKKK